LTALLHRGEEFLQTLSDFFPPESDNQNDNHQYREVAAPRSQLQFTPAYRAPRLVASCSGVQSVAEAGWISWQTRGSGFEPHRLHYV